MAKTKHKAKSSRAKPKKRKKVDQKTRYKKWLATMIRNGHVKSGHKKKPAKKKSPKSRGVGAGHAPSIAPVARRPSGGMSLEIPA